MKYVDFWQDKKVIKVVVALGFYKLASCGKGKLGIRELFFMLLVFSGTFELCLTMTVSDGFKICKEERISREKTEGKIWLWVFWNF